MTTHNHFYKKRYDYNRDVVATLNDRFEEYKYKKGI